MGALRLLVADGNELARKGLCAFVREHPGWEVAAEARNGREAIAVAKQTKPDVAIMDIFLPLLNGLDATRQIAKSGLQTRVLLLNSRDSDQLFSQALEAGARGYLVKSDPADALVSAVEALSYGKMFFSARASQDVVGGYLKTRQDVEKNDPKDAACLTSRQREVLQLVAEGNSSKQVAAALNISSKTAETHRSHIMKRIDCHTVAALVRYAIRNHMITA